MKRFKPGNGEEYHFSTSAGEIGTAVWQDNYSDIQRYLLGNCFRTIKETQAKINNDKAIAAGRVVMVNVPDGYEIDFIRPSEHNNFRWSEVHFKPIPPPLPPKEIVVKAYDEAIHGQPSPSRPWELIDDRLLTKYYYTDELEGL